MTRRNPDEARALLAMRNLIGKDRDCGLKWTEAEVVAHAAEVLGGDEQAKLTAQRVFDKHLKVMGAV